jgi:hypothetical protein
MTMKLISVEINLQLFAALLNYLDLGHVQYLEGVEPAKLFRKRQHLISLDFTKISFRVQQSYLQIIILMRELA